MSTKPDGGPAFPVTWVNAGAEPMPGLEGESIPPGMSSTYSGMTLRAYLAGQALAGITSNPASGCNTPRDLAHWAVQCADATIKELAK